MKGVDQQQARREHGDKRQASAEKRDRSTDTERFYAKTTRMANGCLEWTAGQSGGYGTFTMDGGQISAHRAVLRITTGELLGPHEHVMHSCDNTLCVEISHLRVGTQAENNADRAAKKRSNNLRGENHPNAKYSDQEVEKIRLMLTDGRSLAEIARTIGCSETTVSGIRDGKTRTLPTRHWESIRTVRAPRRKELQAIAEEKRVWLAGLQDTIIAREDMLDGESWRPTTHAGYFASSFGRIRGPKGRILKPANVNGYHRVGVRRVSALVHILVCEAFHGARPGGMEVAHNDGVRNNNRAYNLRWATRKDNHHDKKAHGTWPVGPGLKGEANGNSKLTADQVLEIRAVLPRPRGTQNRLANQYGVRTTTIANVWNHKFWNEE